MDCSLPGSSVHGIFKAIVLEWVAISFSRDIHNLPSERREVVHTVTWREIGWTAGEIDVEPTTRLAEGGQVARHAVGSVF